MLAKIFHSLHIINNKIAEVRGRDFQKSPYAEIRKADLENPDFKHYKFSSPYQVNDVLVWRRIFTKS